jgi:N4-(beta-N-acetylglucosaminyl)-L-asparaginase
MNTRRRFLRQAALGTLGLAFGSQAAAQADIADPDAARGRGPIVLSTWNHGLPANEAAIQALNAGKSVLDAVELGVKVVEADPENGSVGLSGMPDRDGRVTLDACIMDALGRCGSVSCLEHIKHPISVARKVMEDTPHVMLVGEGALRFALDKGFPREKNTLNERQEKAWKEWLRESDYKPVINIENHDTIGLLAMDAGGNFAGACTTSGLAFKLHGRVGDSPIIGAGLYVDNEVGAATSTGLGEAVLRTLGSFLVVELMRQGKHPQAACEEAVRRIVRKHPNHADFQVGFLAIDKKGRIGAHALHKGFNYALHRDGQNRLQDATWSL